MPKNSGIGKDFPVDGLIGGRKAPQSVVVRGMAALEGELTQHFRQRLKADAELEKAMRPQQLAMGGLLKQQDPDGRMIKDLRALQRKHAKAKLPVLEPVAERARIFSGSIGTTRVPPYDYQWTWRATSGIPIAVVSAAANSGAMSFGLNTQTDQASASVAAAVGIFFRPAVDNGILRIWANPALSYNWETWAHFASAHSDGWVGLYVGRYTLAGGAAGAPVRQQLRLWSDDSWLYGANDSGSTSGFPLFAQINVESSHWYAIWVWCGGRVSGAGDSIFSFSAADAGMNARVPAITWELI